jgi:hypothetical protein
MRGSILRQFRFRAAAGFDLRVQSVASLEIMATIRAYRLCSYRRCYQSRLNAIKAVNPYSLARTQRPCIANGNVCFAKSCKLRACKDANVSNSESMRFLRVRKNHDEAWPFECLKSAQNEHSESFTFSRNLCRAGKNKGYNDGYDENEETIDHFSRTRELKVATRRESGPA